VAPPDPHGPWCEQFWMYLISESFHVNMTYSGSLVLEKKIFKWPHSIFAFLWLSHPWRRRGTLFEQFKIPITIGWFVPSLTDIGLLVLEKKIFENCQCIFTLLLLSPLGKRQSTSFEQFRIPSPKDNLCQIWLKLAQCFWRRRRKCKSLRTDGRTARRTDRQTDNGRSE
jgi:hypothetical protein